SRSRQAIGDDGIQYLPANVLSEVHLRTVSLLVQLQNRADIMLSLHNKLLQPKLLCRISEAKVLCPLPPSKVINDIGGTRCSAFFTLFADSPLQLYAIVFGQCPTASGRRGHASSSGARYADFIQGLQDHVEYTAATDTLHGGRANRLHACPRRGSNR